ncbi:MAG: Rho termination factor N-terminal domain-containing protein, partial [Nocardioidaceae bacterium]
MTETTEATPEVDEKPSTRKKSGGLSSMLLPELKQLASSLGIKGVGGMRKSALIDAIAAAQRGGQDTGSSRSDTTSSQPTTQSVAAPSTPAVATAPAVSSTPAAQPPSSDETAGRAPEANEQRGDRHRGRASRGDDTAEKAQDTDEAKGQRGDDRRENRDKGQDREREGQDRERDGRDRDSRDRERDSRDRDSRDRDRDSRDRDSRDRDDRSGRSRRSRSRSRDRNRNRDRDRDRSEVEPQVSEDDVLIPVAGILDLLDNYAFVRTSGYLPGPNDVYVSMSMVRKFGLRKGDAITGAVKQPRDGEQQQGNRREKFNALVRIDTVNGTDPEAARERVDFAKLTPLYPNDRLRLET